MKDPGPYLAGFSPMRWFLAVCGATHTCNKLRILIELGWLAFQEPFSIEMKSKQNCCVIPPGIVMLMILRHAPLPNPEDGVLTSCARLEDHPT